MHNRNFDLTCFFCSGAPTVQHGVLLFAVASSKSEFPASKLQCPK